MTDDQVTARDRDEQAEQAEQADSAFLERHTEALGALDVGDEMVATLTRRQRADLVIVRQTILRVAAGHDDVDVTTAAVMLDQLLRESCPHDPAGWAVDRDEDDRPITMCWACQVGWYAVPA